jgi:hypothetical protein
VARRLIAGLLATVADGVRAESIILASTTSLQDSGLLEHILPAFTKASGIEVRVLAQGSGQALATAARGDADLVARPPPRGRGPVRRRGARDRATADRLERLRDRRPGRGLLLRFTAPLLVRDHRPIRAQPLVLGNRSLVDLFDAAQNSPSCQFVLIPGPGARGPPRSCRAQSGRRGRAAGDQPSAQWLVDN